MVLEGKMFFILLNPYTEWYGSPPEVFYYKGFLQISSKVTGENPSENITSETHLNGE